MDLGYSGRLVLPNKSTQMDEEYIFERLEPVPVKYGLSGIVMSVFFFQCLGRFMVSLGLPKTVRPADAWKFRNLVISWSHALLATVWDLYSFYYYGQEIAQDPVAFHNMNIYALICFSTGYFVYDYMDIIMHVGHLAQWEVLMHHYSVGGMFFYNLMQSRCIAYACIALTVEANTVFLHTRKLMQMGQVPFKSRIYRIAVYCNLISFLIFRFLPLAAILIGMYRWGHRVTTAYMVTLSVAMFVMIGINIVLFWRLISSDILRKDEPEDRPTPSSPKLKASAAPPKPLLELNGHIMQTVSRHAPWEQLQYGLNVVHNDGGKDKAL